MADESTRTKMLKEAPAEGKFKELVKSGAVKISEMLDKVGLKQEKEYEGKTKEELSVKKRAGGKVSSASSRADGCAVRGKTRGRMV
jgi:hypothetical protein